MSKTKIIAVSVKKGGEGKTTLSTNQSALLAKSGAKTLLIDLDPQGHVIHVFGQDPKKLQHTIYTVLKGNTDLKDVVIENIVPNLDILPSNNELDYFIAEPGGSKRVGNLITKIAESGKYKYIVIDTAPAFNNITYEIYDRSDLVLIPFTCSNHAEEALNDIVKALPVLTEVNNKVQLLIVPNKYKLLARNGVESKNSMYKQSLDAQKENVRNNKNIIIGNFISLSDQYNIAEVYEQLPLVLVKKQTKSMLKPISEQEELLKNIVKLLVNKK
ncbi:MAG: AAA family ATPase [Mycoplasmataceae bacterium]|jgi:cellulose biosynthesis protein BcsQ|nr:AAA family ATPase [Mycoplasmataceae bacterium]